MTDTAQTETAHQYARNGLDYPEVPVGAVLAGSARRFGDRVSLHFQGRELTFSEIHRRACAFANALGSAGIGRGDVVAVHLPNCPQYPSAYFGILAQAGAARTTRHERVTPG